MGATYVSQFGTSGTNPGQFNGPVGVAVSPANGDVYVTDYENDRVQRFTAGGSFVSLWGGTGSGNGQFREPYHLTIDATGNVYVADFVNDRVQKFDATGAYVAQFGGTGSGPGDLNGPTGIAISPLNGDLYVADRDNHRVQRFTTAGAYVSQFGSFGSGNGQFNQPFGIGINAAGELYVADVQNVRVQRFSAAGAYLGQFGSPGAGNGQFSRPNGVTVGPAGDVYVTDVFNDRVQKFTGAGTYSSQFGGAGSGPGQFDDTYGIWATPAGDLYVTDYNNDRVQRFSDIPQAVNVTPPAITGDAYQGKTIGGNAGTWTGAAPITYVYTWLRCNSAGLACVPATAPSPPTTSTTAPAYVITPADLGKTLILSVTADNAANQPAAAQSAPTAVVSKYSDVVLLDNPLAYWRLGDAGDFEFMSDSSGNGHHGEYKNGAGGSVEVGISGDGDTIGVFTGNGTYGYVNGLDAPRTTMSVEAWIRPSDLDPAQIFHHGGAGALYITDGQRLAFRPEDNRPASQLDAPLPGGFTVNEFHHVAATYDGAVARLYLDGALLASGPRYGRGSGTATLYVGYGWLAPWFRGSIDEVAYYGHVLSPARVLEHYTADPPPPLLVPRSFAPRTAAPAAPAAPAADAAPPAPAAAPAGLTIAATTTKAQATAKAKRARAKAKQRAKAKAQAKAKKRAKAKAKRKRLGAGA